MLMMDWMFHQLNRKNQIFQLNRKVQEPDISVSVGKKVQEPDVSIWTFLLNRKVQELDVSVLVRTAF